MAIEYNTILTVKVNTGDRFRDAKDEYVKHTKDEKITHDGFLNHLLDVYDKRKMKRPRVVKAVQ